MLVAFYAPKAEELGTTYKEYLAKKGLKEDDPGVAVGQKAAADTIALRADDGRVPNPAPAAWMGETAMGKWRPVTTPAVQASAGMAAPWMGDSQTFRHPERQPIPSQQPPPDLNSEAIRQGL